MLWFMKKILVLKRSILKFLGIRSYDVCNFPLHNSARQEIIMNIYTYTEKENKCGKMFKIGEPR